jgi:hypothetical protein
VLLNLLTLGVILTVQAGMLIGIPLRAYLGMLSLVMASVAAGWLLGGPGSGNRTAMAMATGVRNVGVSLVIATSSFPGTPAVTATTAFALFQTVLLGLVALGWGRLASAPAEGTNLQGSFSLPARGSVSEGEVSTPPPAGSSPGCAAPH